MRRRLTTGDFTLTELLHHLRMFNAVGCLELETVLFKKIDSHVKRRALVPIHKGVVARDRLGIAGRKLERICLAVWVLVLGPGQGGLKQCGISQPLRATCHLDHGLMDELDLLAWVPSSVRQFHDGVAMTLKATRNALFVTVADAICYPCQAAIFLR